MYQLPVTFTAGWRKARLAHATRSCVSLRALPLCWDSVTSVTSMLGQCYKRYLYVGTVLQALPLPVGQCYCSLDRQFICCRISISTAFPRLPSTLSLEARAACSACLRGQYYALRPHSLLGLEVYGTYMYMYMYILLHASYFYQ